MHPVGHGRDQVAQEVAGDATGGFLVQFRKGKLTRAVDGYEEVELAVLSPHLSDVDGEGADRIRLEPLLRGFLALGLGEPAHAVALQTAVPAGARQVRDRGLEGIEAVIQQQQRVPPKGDNDGLLLDREHGRARLLGASALVLDRGALLPLCDGLRVEAVAPGQPPQARLTLLDRATHRRCRAGAPMKNWAHSASLHSGEKNAPSNPGTKQNSPPEMTANGEAACRARARSVREGSLAGVF